MHGRSGQLAGSFAIDHPAPQTSFPVDGCPIDDEEACDVIARSATALVAGDAADLMEVSQPDRFDCAGLPVDVFPGWTARSFGVIRSRRRSR
jgi:hypothetical protein